MQIRLAISAILAGFATSALCQFPSPATTSAFAESVLIGMKLSVARGVKMGKASERRGQCIAALPSDSFSDAVSQLLTQHLTPTELSTAESFFASRAGKKYAQHGILQVYQRVGAPLPTQLPELSDTEYKQLESFAATKVGDVLINQKIMESNSSRQAYQKQIGELLAQCPN